MGVEDLGLIDPSLAGSVDRGHRENHLGKFWSNPRENWLMRLNSPLVPAFIDRFWKSVMYCWNPLSECTELIVSGDLSIEGVESGLKVFDEFVESLFSIGDSVVGHPVIPSFCVGGSSSSAHLVQGSHDLGGVRGVEGGVQDKIGLHGLDPSSGIVVLSREV